jgi:hypothetical protein
VAKGSAASSDGSIQVNDQIIQVSYQMIQVIREIIQDIYKIMQVSGLDYAVHSSDISLGSYYTGIIR